MQPHSISIDIPTSMWQPAGEDESRLICAIRINGTDMHLEAIRVRSRARSRVQHAINWKHCADFDLLRQFSGDGDFETTEINGKQYVLIATPFS